MMNAHLALCDRMWFMTNIVLTKISNLEIMRKIWVNLNVLNVQQMEAVARPYMLASIPKSYMFYRRIASQHYFTPSGGMDDLPGLAELVKAALLGGQPAHQPISAHDLTGQTIRMTIVGRKEHRWSGVPFGPQCSTDSFQFSTPFIINILIFFSN